MQYDPIKIFLGKIFGSQPFFRKIFYRLLDILFLRAWYIRHELKQLHNNHNYSILDAGSGFGQYTYRMKHMFPSSQILAIDLKEEQMEDCRQFFNKAGLKKGVSFKKADLTKFIKNDSFDLVLSVDVMEHITEDEKVFSNFYKSLKKNGTLIISTPSDQGGSDTDHGENFISEHVRDGYSIYDIKEKLNTAGFTNISAQYSYGKPGNISWLLSIKYPIIMLGKSKLFFIFMPFYYLLIILFCLILNFIDLKSNLSRGTGLIVKAIK